MQGINSITFAGTITKEPRVSENKIDFSCCCVRDFVNRDGETKEQRTTMFVTLWFSKDKQPDLREGDFVCAYGSLNSRKADDKWYTYINAREVVVMNRAASAEAIVKENKDDFPF